MTPRTAAWLAWSGFALWAAMIAGIFVLIASGRGTVDEGIAAASIGYALVGALVAAREPRNAVGWLLLVVGLCFAAQAGVDAYIAGADPLPGRTAVAWCAGWIWYGWLYLAALVLPVVFPTGRPESRRATWALRIGVTALAVSAVADAFRPGPLDVDAVGVIVNPVGLPASFGTAMDVLGVVGSALAAVGFVLGFVHLVLRLRQVTGRERQQLKSFAYVGGLALVCCLVAMGAVAAEPFVEESEAPPAALVIGAAGWFGALFAIVVGIPAAVGFTILRHRLYDIDLVIKRTLVYGSLTAVLVATYLGLVLGFRVVLAPVTGDSDLAVAASTLAVAALFRPARGRIQGVVDRRFFRARYDAAQTLEHFAGRLREELDIEALGTDLGTVVRQTMQPAHVSLWLREAPR
jgi:hypothetical protein